MTFIWQSLPILNKILILICWTMTIPFIIAVAFSILLTLIFFIPGLFLFARWLSIISTYDSDFNVGDMKVPTFFSTGEDGDEIAYIFCMPFVGVVFGGIHCVGWFFNFPSGVEAMLWRVSSAVLTGIAFLFPLFFIVVSFFLKYSKKHGREYFASAISTIILLVYVVSRLFLLVEAFISLRHLTPGMLALVKWTSFIPHI